MDDARAKTLRQQIAMYRRYLADGVDGDLAARYLREIKRMRAELSQLDEKEDAGV